MNFIVFAFLFFNAMVFAQGSQLSGFHKDVAEARISSSDRELIESHRQKAENGDLESQFWLAEFYLQVMPDSPANMEWGIKWLRLAANRGHAKAQYNLGTYYQKGFGVIQDYGKAFHFYELAAKQGLDRAQRSLAFLYSKGWGVERDYKKAHYFYQLAAQQGNARAQNGLGILYQNGLGVEKNDKKAFDFYQRAAQQKHVFAQYNVAVMYKNGFGVEQDYKKALDFYRQAAGQGDSWSQYDTGVMYQEGLGVEQDLKEAAYFYELAARQGHIRAQRVLVRLYEDLHDDVSACFWQTVLLENKDKTKSIKGKILKQKMKRFFLERKLDKEQKKHLKIRLQEWHKRNNKIVKKQPE